MNVSKTQKSINGILFISFIPFAFGLGGLIFHVWPQYQAAKTTSPWPSVKGTIVDSRLTISRRKTDNGVRNFYNSNISYEYHVNGIKYKASRIYIGNTNPTSTIKSNTVELLKKYPKGKVLNVYYSPKDPSEAVLKPGAQEFHIQSVIFLSVAALLGTFGLMFGFLKLFRVRNTK